MTFQKVISIHSDITVNHIITVRTNEVHVNSHEPHLLSFHLQVILDVRKTDANSWVSTFTQEFEC